VGQDSEGKLIVIAWIPLDGRGVISGGRKSGRVLERKTPEVVRASILEAPSFAL
jgi:hypothetical protein